MYFLKNTEGPSQSGLSVRNKPEQLHLKPNNQTKAYHGFSADLGSNSEVLVTFPGLSLLWQVPELQQVRNFATTIKGGNS